MQAGMLRLVNRTGKTSFRITLGYFYINLGHSRFFAICLVLHPLDFDPDLDGAWGEPRSGSALSCMRIRTLPVLEVSSIIIPYRCPCARCVRRRPSPCTPCQRSPSSLFASGTRHSSDHAPAPSVYIRLTRTHLNEIGARLFFFLGSIKIKVS